MTAGQCCVVLARPGVEAMKRTPVVRCLFGAPDPEETRKLVEEDFAANRERMLRWGVDILALQSSNSSPVTPVFRPTPYSRQTRISDFWRIKKVSHSVKSSNGLQKIERIESNPKNTESQQP